MADPEPTLEPQRLGSYLIVRKLARGGMAELYLARGAGPEGIDRLVVLKKILPRFAHNGRYVQLFLDEAKLAASLDHPHIVRVFDQGRADGQHYFSMEYIHGQDLRSVLRRTGREHRMTPIPLAVAIGRAVASGLHHAHEQRGPDGALREIVHRDVSPSNILTAYDGAIKLADFGVAKAVTSSIRTRTGTLKGKVGYMSPEQARGQSIDRRSDIFSLGVVLWELIAVRRLFKSDNDLATIQAIIHTSPRALPDLRSDCPAELDRIVRKALAKDPATRYQTAAELERDLAELAKTVGPDEPRPALARYLEELFAAELAAWREAQASGTTITDYLVSVVVEPKPASQSEASLGGGTFEPDEPDDPAEEPEEELEPEDAVDPLAQQTVLSPPPSVDGAAESGSQRPGEEPTALAQQTVLSPPPSQTDTGTHRAIDEATALAPPPVMAELLAASGEPSTVSPPRVAPSVIPRRPRPEPVIDTPTTTVDADPFEDSAEPGVDDAETVAVPTPTPPPTPPPRPGGARAPSSPAAPRPVVTTQGPAVARPPSIGSGSGAAPVPVAAAESGPAAAAPFPRLHGLPPMPPPPEPDYAAIAERRLVLFGIASGGLIVLLVLIAIIAGIAS